jgi:AraC family transcriptional regulator of adaptative response/methylated-DNA-[protein]-cysteine methyltransferase
MSFNPANDQRILNLAQYIEDNALEVLTLDDLAQQAALSPFHLQRKFKATFGVSPKQFQNSLRIQHLKQSLKQGDDISGAIYGAGFGSTSRVYEQINDKLGMTPSNYRAGGKGMHIAFASRKTSLGCILMAATERGVCFVHLGDSLALLLEKLHIEFPAAELEPTPEHMNIELDLWIDALEKHLSGNAPKPQLPLHLFGTAFQLKVWKFLISVKDGSTASYKEVANGINKPTAFRAVANACGANNVAVLIPCHRVLRGDGQLGGYRWGGERKQALLALERNS